MYTASSGLSLYTAVKSQKAVSAYYTSEQMRNSISL